MDFGFEVNYFPSLTAACRNGTEEIFHLLKSKLGKDVVSMCVLPIDDAPNSAPLLQLSSGFGQEEERLQIFSRLREDPKSFGALKPFFPGMLRNASGAGHSRFVSTLLTVLPEKDWRFKINTTDGNGRTALWHAANANRAVIVGTLLKLRNVKDIRDMDGLSALEIAVLQGADETVEIFANHSQKFFDELIWAAVLFDKQKILRQCFERLASSERLSVWKEVQPNIPAARKQSVCDAFGMSLVGGGIVSMLQKSKRYTQSTTACTYVSHIVKVLCLCRKSILTCLTKKYPLFNEVPSKLLLPGFIDSVQQRHVDEIRRLRLLNSCLPKDHQGRHTGVISDMIIGAGCDDHGRDSNCARLRDLLTLAQRLEARLKASAPQLGISFRLIGSVAERTCLRNADELDITMHFERTAECPLRKGPGMKVLVADDEQSEVARYLAMFSTGDRRLFSYPKFLKELCDVVSKAVRKTIASDSPVVENLSAPMWNSEYRPCEKCRDVSALENVEFVPNRHCLDCRPAVAITKKGLCLNLDWKSSSKEGVLTPCSIDLIPFFYVWSAKRYRPLRTLLEQKPAEWLPAFTKAVTRERFLREEKFKARRQTKKMAMKIVNFGDEDSVMLSLSEEIDIEQLEDEMLKDIYCILKWMKSEGVSSYTIKRVLLQPEFLPVALNSVDHFTMLEKVLNHTEIRKLFSSVEDVRCKPRYGLDLVFKK